MYDCIVLGNEIYHLSVANDKRIVFYCKGYENRHIFESIYENLIERHPGCLSVKSEIKGFCGALNIEGLMILITEKQHFKVSLKLYELDTIKRIFSGGFFDIIVCPLPEHCIKKIEKKWLNDNNLIFYEFISEENDDDKSAIRLVDFISRLLPEKKAIVISKELGLSQLKKISNNHSSKICGFILYGTENSIVKKVIKDQDFWDEFDVISGPDWPIFAVRELKSENSKKVGENVDVCYSMTMVKNENVNNSDILNFFGIDSNEYNNEPRFILFSWTDDNKLECSYYKINEGTIDEAHNSLLKIIKVISKAERNMKSDYKKTDHAFEDVRLELDTYFIEKKILERSKLLHRAFEYIKDVL